MMESAPGRAARVWALVPLKAPVLAKSRLSARLSGVERARLQWAMLRDVLDQLSRSEWLSGIAVVCPDARIREMLQARGIRVFDDEPRGGGLNGALRLGTRRLREAGAELIVILPADVPLLEVREIDGAIALALRRDTAIVVPDRARAGTNALVFRPEGTPRFRFGADSFAHHLTALGAGRATALPLGSIARDIDTAGDLDFLRRRCRDGAAANTADVLDGFASLAVSQPFEK